MFPWKSLTLLSVTKEGQGFYQFTLYSIGDKNTGLSFVTESSLRDFQGNRKCHQKTFDIVCDENDW